jgi:hypothetical protein
MSLLSAEQIQAVQVLAALGYDPGSTTDSQLIVWFNEKRITKDQVTAAKQSGLG